MSSMDTRATSKAKIEHNTIGAIGSHQKQLSGTFECQCRKMTSVKFEATYARYPRLALKRYSTPLDKSQDGGGT